MWKGAQVLVCGTDYILSLTLLPGDVLVAVAEIFTCAFFPPRKEMALEASRSPEEEAVAVATGAWEPLVASRR